MTSGIFPSLRRGKKRSFLFIVIFATSDNFPTLDILGNFILETKNYTLTKLWLDLFSLLYYEGFLAFFSFVLH